MDESLDYKTFDLGEFLAGANRPTEVVSVYMDEDLGYLINTTNRELQRLSNLGRADEYTILEEKFLGLIEAAKETRFEVHLKGVSRKMRRDILTSILAEFPSKTDLFGRPENNAAGQEAYAKKLWSVHIQKIVRADGSVLEPVTPEDIQVFRDFAPDPAVDAIDGAIAELTDGVKSGFELAAQDTGFLSTP